jgi:hypothetical protein
MKKLLFFTLPLFFVFLAAGGVIYFFYFFEFGEGVKTGELNYVVRKGYIFKTYEGKMIQTGFKSSQSAIQSNEFVFSIEDEEMARKLMEMGGENIDLYYKEYKRALPWRGNSNYVVDSFVVRGRQNYMQPYEQLPPILPMETTPSTPGTSL